MVLEAALVEIVEVVEGCVVVLWLFDEGEIDPLEASLHEDGKVGGIGHGAVDRDVGRAAHGPLKALGHLVDYP